MEREGTSHFHHFACFMSVSSTCAFLFVLDCLLERPALWGS